jgi:thiamine-monophosphate kinase
MTLPDTAGQLGEREIIRRLSRWLTVGATGSGDFGTGDDCAELAEAPPGTRMIVTKDLLVEGTHFLRAADTDWYLVGRKAAGANISDLAAAGCVPRALLVGVAIPPDLPVAALEELYRGMHEAAVLASARIIGGDTTRGERLVLSITAIGAKPESWADCRRSDARVGDIIYVTGHLGGSRAGLDLILSPDKGDAIDCELADALVKRHFIPPSRLDAAIALARRGQRMAMIDISDSLYNEAALSAEASGVQMELELNAVPVARGAARFCAASGADSARFALFSGEEYELLFTSEQGIEELSEIFRATGVECPLTQLGAVKPGTGVRVLRGGNPVDPSDETFVHF